MYIYSEYVGPFSNIDPQAALLIICRPVALATLLKPPFLYTRCPTSFLRIGRNQAVIYHGRVLGRTVRVDHRLVLELCTIGGDSAATRWV